MAAAELPSNNTLIVAALSNDADRPAFVHRDRTVTYGQAKMLVSQLMASLRARTIGPGSTVGILSSNRPEAWLAQAAVNLVGGVVVGMHAKASPEEHAFICDDANVQLLLTDRQHEDTAAAAVEISDIEPALAVLGAGGEHPDLIAEAALQAAGRVDAGPSRSRDLVEILYTGGTTGRAKGVMQSHRSRSAITLLAPMAYELPTMPVYLACTPITHAAAHFVLPTLLQGGTVVLNDGFDPGEFTYTVRRHHVNTTFMVPSMVYKLLDHAAASNADTSLPSLERVVYGASPMSTTRLIEAHDRYGHIFTQIYGQTETLALGTALRSKDHDLSDLTRLASCGRVVPGMTLALLDDGGNEVKPGEIGEICLRGPGVMEGYLNQPELTEEALAGGWLHTGDMARADDQRFLTIVDRKKDFIITGGFNVYSREVEDVLTAHPSVSAAAVFGIPDPVWGEAVTAVVVVREGHNINPDELKAFVKSAKGSVSTPKRIEAVESIPATALGKTDKKQLRARYWSGLDRAVN